VLPRKPRRKYIVRSLDTKSNSSQNFPFATIDPEESRVLVPDDRYDWLCEKYNPKSRVPAHLTIYDIAGLTRGASTGAGLGNAFLSHIRAVDAIFQVVRCFDDAEIIHIEGDVDPVRDLTIISEELRIKDIEFTEKALENLKKLTRRGGQSLEMKKLKEEEACVEKVLKLLQDGGDVRKGDWTTKEVCCKFSFEYYIPHFHDDKGP
jgi:obg-like ATPase 1